MLCLGAGDLRASRSLARCFAWSSSLLFPPLTEARFHQEADIAAWSGEGRSQQCAVQQEGVGLRAALPQTVHWELAAAVISWGPQVS